MQNFYKMFVTIPVSMLSFVIIKFWISSWSPLMLVSDKQDFISPKPFSVKINLEFTHLFLFSYIKFMIIHFVLLLYYFFLCWQFVQLTYLHK